MYDSDDPSAIPDSAAMVAGYLDGDSGRWSQADWDRFPNATKVRIVRREYTNDGDVIDCEEGIVWPPDRAVNWVVMRRLAGAWPSVYCNQLNGWPLVRRAFQDRGVEEPPYWVARYNGVEDIPLGSVAKQYANEFLHQQGHFDLSIVADHWPGIDDGGNAMTPQDEAIVVEVAKSLRGGVGGDHPAGDLFLLLLGLRDTLAATEAALAALAARVDALVGPGVTLTATGEISIKPQ